MSPGKSESLPSMVACALVSRLACSGCILPVYQLLQRVGHAACVAEIGCFVRSVLCAPLQLAPLSLFWDAPLNPRLPLPLQLGLSDTGYAASNAAYGEGTGPIAFDEVSCTGNEATIQQCPRSSVVDW